VALRDTVHPTDLTEPRTRQRRNALRRAGAIALSAVTLAVTQAILAPNTHASNSGSTPCNGTPRNCVSLGDNATHSWYPEGTFGNHIPGIASSFQIAMNGYHNDTDLVITKDNHATLDVLVTDFDYGANGAIGWVECIPGSSTSGSHPGLRCDRQKLRLNGSYANQFDTAQERESLSCHEIGHTVGLRHRNEENSCMSTAAASTTSTRTSLHDDAHINANH
jgi:hypothetical protein